MRTPKISKKSKFQLYRTHAKNAELRGDYGLAAKNWWVAVRFASAKEALELGVINAERCERLANLDGGL